jgi:pimeloyl-ACP methyl ester carboxylesterase
MTLIQLTNPMRVTCVLVMLCGLGGTAAGFTPAHAPRAPGLLVLALDYTRHTSIDAMAASVWEQLDEDDITQPVVLLGYSMGGFVAQSAACMAPARVRGIIFVSTAILAIEDMREAVEAIPPQVFADLTWAAPGSERHENAKMKLIFSESWLRARSMHKSTQLAEKMAAVAAPRSVFLAELRAVVAHAIVTRGEAARCLSQLPVLVLHGDQDMLFPAGVTLGRIQRALPAKSTSIVVFESGHALITEQTAAFRNVVEHWLRAACAQPIPTLG